MRVLVHTYTHTNTHTDTHTPTHNTHKHTHTHTDTHTRPHHLHTHTYTHTHAHTQTLLPGDLPGLRLVCKALGETTEQGVCCSGQTVMKLAEPYQPPAETKTDYAGTFRGNSAGTSCNKREVSWG